MKLGDIKYLLSLSPKIIIKKVFQRFKSSVKDKFYKKTVLTKDSRRNLLCPSVNENFLIIDHLDVSKVQAREHLLQLYLGHRHDILGSGWVRTNYAVIACGLENIFFETNLPFSEIDDKGVWMNDILPSTYLDISRKYWVIIRHTLSEYEPIDWQRDLKSGFRWNARVWYKDQRKLIGGQKGIDLKVPWELSRLHHLPQIALFALNSTENRERCIREFKCQALDFFSVNPPGLGVNYNCAMDVGIRAANLIIAFDIFTQIDDAALLDSEFRLIFSQNLYLHGRHILEDLEYREGLTSNHYLGNIVGLLFISAYLESEPEIDRWLAFSVQELISCMERQFFEDGSNFEGSTSYHRLSGEMMLYGAALIAGLNDKKRKALAGYTSSSWSYQAPLFVLGNQKYDVLSRLILPESYFKKLFRAALFSHYITKPNGCVVQFGDNDSGRFLRLSPNGEMLSHNEAIDRYINLKDYGKHYCDDWYWDENDLSHAPFLAGCSALFDDERLQKYAKVFPLERSLVKSLSRGAQWDKCFNEELSKASVVQAKFNPSDFVHRIETFLAFPNDEVHFKKDSLELKVFCDFQIYMIRSDCFLLAIAGISNPEQHHSWGHTHNDKLAIELNVDGHDLALDSGTYLYTPLPENRNAFRSIHAHNTLITSKGEQNKWSDGRMGLFKIYRDTRVKLLDASEHSLTLALNYRSIHQVRQLVVQSDGVLVRDFSNVPFETGFGKQPFYSNGYGKLLKNSLFSE